MQEDKTLGIPTSLEQATELMQADLAEEKLIILTNPTREFYYAFRLIPNSGVSVKYGSFSQDLNQLKTAPCSAKDLLMRQEVALGKLVEKWGKFPVRNIYAGPENIKYTWDHLAAALNGSLRAHSPNVITASAQAEATNYLREYKQLIKIRARQNGLDEPQLQGAVTREIFKLQRAGQLTHKGVVDMLDNPEEVIAGTWNPQEAKSPRTPTPEIS
jgi:hypothetical protein